MASKRQHPYTSVAVSRKRQRRPCPSGDRTTTVRSPLPSIPFDILIDIFKRSDTATVVRCAATAKPIRHAILDPDFLRELRALRAEANGGSNGFDPALLVGVTFAFSSETCRYKHRAAPPIVSRSSSLRFDAGILRTFQPVASRGGLVVLRRRFDRSEPLRLLVADQEMRTQIFSSEHGEWGAVVKAHVNPPRLSLPLARYASHPVVLGRITVYWLCSYSSIVALDVGAAQATVIGVPLSCFSRMSETQRQEGPDDGLLLVASADGKLGMLVAEYLLICMWTMSAAVEETGSSSTAAATRWTRQVVIQRHAIDRQGPGWPVRFLGFGERSGTVILQLHEVGLIEINLGSKETRVIGREFRYIGGVSPFQMCLHETDLSTLFHSMEHI
ncbi:hypothetical protein EJB05_04240, partial [Eragrostis curvula]